MITYEQIVEECKRLRSRHERAEAEFFMFLLQTEQKHEAVWREAGCQTFDQFLRSNQLCDSGRYRFFAIGVSRVGAEEALQNGAPWTITVGKQPDAPVVQLDEFRSRASAFTAAQKVAPSEQTTREWANQIFTRGDSKHATIRRVDELSRLKEENKRLRAELAAAKMRIEELERIAV